MPHFAADRSSKDYLTVMKMIDGDKLILLDKDLPQLGKNRRGVVQRFDMDVYTALKTHIEEIDKYKNVVLIMPKHSNHPREIAMGITRFCEESQKQLQLLDEIQNLKLTNNTLYISTLEDDLAVVIKAVRKSVYCLGKDIGILSFNETVFKELLDISVITTDFKQMGAAAAEMILFNKRELLFNPFYLIKRNSF